jgi:ABC-type branched-subunit amino acid transport system ATPase component
MTDTLLKTTNLTKTFNSLVANDNIDLSIERGEILGIIGPNGSGKTTFFNTVTGFYNPDDGTVQFNGEDVTGWETYRLARQGLGRTFQIVSPFKNMTVRQNLLAVQTDDEESQQERRERAEEILSFLEIDHIAENRAMGMSGGQQKLLELARVLMLDPELIMLDEPAAGVNPVLEEQIIEQIKTLNNNGTSFVVVEHDMNVIRELASEVSVFDSGEHIAQGSFEDVSQDERVRQAYLGGADDEEVPI